jgi:protease I
MEADVAMELDHKRIAIFAEDKYEDPELLYPYYRMREAGAQVSVIGMPGVEEYESKHGYPISVDLAATEAKADDFDALIIPGGYAPDRMRRHPPMLDLVREMFTQGKLIAMICHAGWVPISAGILEGRRATSFFSIKDDMINAGVQWVDQEVVVDGNLISSRNPEDLPAFCRAIIETLQAD